MDLDTNVTFTSASPTTDAELEVTHAGARLLTTTIKAAQNILAAVRNVAKAPVELHLQIPELAVKSLLSNAAQAKTTDATVIADVRLDGALTAPRVTASLLVTDGPDARLQVNATAGPGSANPLQATLMAKRINIAPLRRFLPGVTVLQDRPAPLPKSRTRAKVGATK